MQAGMKIFYSLYKMLTSAHLKRSSPSIQYMNQYMQTYKLTWAVPIRAYRIFSL